MKLVPLSDRVVLKQCEAEETTKSGIILTSSAQEKPQEAEGIAVGPGGMVDGKEVTNDYEFTADKENMEVQIEFTFDGSTLGGKQLVTFEELYDMTNPEEPKKVTEHKEINDEGQTVTIKEVPETPPPETPGTTTKTSNPPKKGNPA